MLQGSHSPPLAVRERFFREAMDRRELAPKAVAGVRDLLQHGLNFEQALVGTGLISTTQFLRWLETASGLTALIALDATYALPAGMEREVARAWNVIPQKAKDGWTIGLTDPWDYEVRAAIEALSVEHGWKFQFACLTPSLADRWREGLQKTSASHDARHSISRVARALVERETTASREHLRDRVPAAHVSALQLRLARRAILPRANQPAPHAQNGEHPLLEWSDALAMVFRDTSRLVFLLDPEDSLARLWSLSHVPHSGSDWRTGKRWVAEADPSKQEELFHLALAGYAGTVRFSSVKTLKEWEQAAQTAGVAFTTCHGHATPHGFAWSIYPVASDSSLV